MSQPYKSNAGGTATAFGSALLAGSSIGSNPMVANNDLAITREVVANGAVLSCDCKRNSRTRTDSIHAGDHHTTHGLGKKGLAPGESTTQSFVGDFAEDEKVAEHAFCFGPKGSGATACWHARPNEHDMPRIMPAKFLVQETAAAGRRCACLHVVRRRGRRPSAAR